MRVAATTKKRRATISCGRTTALWSFWADDRPPFVAPASCRCGHSYCGTGILPVRSWFCGIRHLAGAITGEMPITQSNTFCVPTQNPVVIQFALGFVSGQSRDCKGAVSREDRSFTVAVLIKQNER